ncbi:similar to Saccharomyces cerevisiae YGL185C Putative protein with sequence similarity to hydroxyacid dehydrogenases [Maudiozyma saulgeensis]|uniref:D-isomer specific 2-hydroxyacid dehydrogenase NAD-binding domain-containing protein n=1 Tax=Maudiozyma saulgeensis TaxID=1789683 RepID=A0A1X7QZ86_9SACH|nr:similar to Saccharomyces cerevisiae YGL185C Putative protein with sequence similarity to hydroxyacid dehydrogenases [Kazachstania saulgeensis]
MKKTILCMQTPNVDSPLLKQPEIISEYDFIIQEITSRDQLLECLKSLKDKNANIVAIYGGFGAFPMIGGLTSELINDPLFPSDTLKCIALCSRGYNGYDLNCLKEHNIALYNYQDTEQDSLVTQFQIDQVGNDVADCALWHVLEGFRKFSYQQSLLRKNGHTVNTRSIMANSSEANKFAFGHELTNKMLASSPKGKKCLLFGLGSIGKQIAIKLQIGLGMEVHYTARHESKDKDQDGFNWKFHNIETLLSQDVDSELNQFNAIVIALPATPQTYHLINSQFLQKCNKQLVLVNIGRGDIIDMDAINEAINNEQIRHFGTDVFHDEPKVDNILREDILQTTITPHVGSATSELFSQSCELALMNIVRTTSDRFKSEPNNSDAELCRVI